MPAVQHQTSLALNRETVKAFYPEVVQRTSGRERKIPLSPEIMEAIPARVRTVIRSSLSRGGMEAFLVDSESGLTVVIRNRRHA